MEKVVWAVSVGRAAASAWRWSARGGRGTGPEAGFEELVEDEEQDAGPEYEEGNRGDVIRCEVVSRQVAGLSEGRTHSQANWSSYEVAYGLLRVEEPLALPLGGIAAHRILGRTFRRQMCQDGLSRHTFQDKWVPGSTPAFT